VDGVGLVVVYVAGEEGPEGLHGCGHFAFDVMVS
jgi:hypothetical protein